MARKLLVRTFSVCILRVGDSVFSRTRVHAHWLDSCRPSDILHQFYFIATITWDNLFPLVKDHVLKDNV